MSADIRSKVSWNEDGTLLSVRGLVKRFPIHSGLLRRVTGHVHAVSSVDFDIRPGETVGLVGESGSGKSTVARLVMRLLDPTDGEIWLGGQDVAKLDAEQVRRLRRRVQMVFQDPYSSFDPLTSIAESIAEPLFNHFGYKGSDANERAAELLNKVGLSPAYLERYPSQMSGGQLQRAAVARALAVDPELLVLDEPVSALDVSTQAQVINLLVDLQRELGISMLFIAHDLAVVRHVSHRIAVMYLGRIVEFGDADEVYERPAHPYTAALLSAIPHPDPVVQRARERIVLVGDIPSPANPPTGCRFSTRCPYAMDVCREVDPPAFVTPSGSTTFCHLHTEGGLAGQSVVTLSTAPA